METRSCLTIGCHVARQQPFSSQMPSSLVNTLRPDLPARPTDARCCEMLQLPTMKMLSIRVIPLARLSDRRLVWLTVETQLFTSKIRSSGQHIQP